MTSLSCDVVAAILTTRLLLFVLLLPGVVVSAEAGGPLSEVRHVGGCASLKQLLLSSSLRSVPGSLTAKCACISIAATPVPGDVVRYRYLVPLVSVPVCWDGLLCCGVLLCFNRRKRTGRGSYDVADASRK